jgi:hypothetical protein
LEQPQGGPPVALIVAGVAIVALVAFFFLRSRDISGALDADFGEDAVTAEAKKRLYERAGPLVGKADDAELQQALNLTKETVRREFAARRRVVEIANAMFHERADHGEDRDVLEPVYKGAAMKVGDQAALFAHTDTPITDDWIRSQIAEEASSLEKIKRLH